jgi:hypothetical protein
VVGVAFESSTADTRELVCWRRWSYLPADADVERLDGYSMALPGSLRRLLNVLAEEPEGHLESFGLKDCLESVSLVDSDQSLTNA